MGISIAATARWAGWLLLSLSCACYHEGPAAVDAPACAAANAQNCRAPSVPPLPSGPPEFCAREGADPVRDVFCDGSTPAIRSLRELQDLLGFDADRQGYSVASGGVLSLLEPGTSANFVAATAHSTSLDGQLVSALNPRVFMLTKRLIIAFQRGAQHIELTTRSDDGASYNFYLLSFRQACNGSAKGCSSGDLYTPRIERDWTAVAIEDDETLKNTPLDCRQCHARGRERMGLLMRELEQPWTHFLLPVDENMRLPEAEGTSGRLLTTDYLSAKGDEAYGNLPEQTLRHTTAVIMQGFAGTDQPLLFDSRTIEQERWPNGLDQAPQPSPTWEAAYAAFKRGEQLALPYVDAKVTDAAKQARLSAAYVRYRAGELTADDLPDLADIFPDDPRVRARIGLQTEPDATPVEALIQACGSCHNYILDQSISRARFNIDLASLDRAALERAVERIELSPNAVGAMPPPQARQLDPGARAQVIAYLRQAATQRDFDPSLQRAAELGMRGTPVR